MQEAASDLLQEQPKLDGAMRNLLSLRMAQAQTAPNKAPEISAEQVKAQFPRGGATIGADGKLKKLDSQEIEDYFNKDKPKVSQMDAAKRLKLAGVVLRSINAHALQDPLQWSNASGQQENQSASSRMDEIMAYKVAHFVSGKVQSQGNAAKITKTLGASYLPIVWPQIRSQVDVSAKSLDSSIEEIEREFADWLPLGDIEEPSDERELVWAKNLADVLAKRHHARAKAAAERSAAAEDSEPRIQEISEEIAEDAAA